MNHRVTPHTSLSLLSTLFCLTALTGCSGGAGEDGQDGAPGADGSNGARGPSGTDGQDGNDGEDGARGPRGERGFAGDEGPNGADGLESLISKTVVEAGDWICKFGGLSINSGLDVNENGSLDSEEVQATEHLCNVEGFEFVGLHGSPLPYQVLRNDLPDGAAPGRNMEIRNGGYGSAMVAHPHHPTQFYGLTDRGPNADHVGGTHGPGKYFPVPDFQPRIGRFEVTAGGHVVRHELIELKRPDGTPITGLPNTSGLGGTGETPYYLSGAPILVDDGLPYDANTNPFKLDDYGLDGEGLVALDDGTFWISDEYGPHMVHFDATGVEMERINPFPHDNRLIEIGGNSVHLPLEFATRRANRGMEGLAITPDQTTLVGIMQSSLANPAGVTSSDLTRIVTVNLVSGVIRQYLYRQQISFNSNSEITALSATEFLIIERDGKFFQQDATAMKHVYRVDLSTGTELEIFAPGGIFAQHDTLGLTINGSTLEQVVRSGANLAAGWNTLASHGIFPIEKELVVDLVQVMGYPHDKLEGLWLISPTQLGVLNDDDFSTWVSSNVLEQKYLDPNHSVIDGGRLYVFSGLDLAPSN